MRTRVLVACLLLLAATACTKADDGGGVASVNGSGAPSPTPSLSELEQLRRHAQCMRAHGVPEPDPQVDAEGMARAGRYPKDSVDHDTLESAKQACRQYELVLSAADSARKAEGAREYARCMRANGYENFPDPDANGQIRIEGEMDPDYDRARAICRPQRTPSPGASR